jgi:hypothetical protein
MASIPGQDARKGMKLHPIEGNPVDVFALPKGCSFAPRCEKCMEICLEALSRLNARSTIHIIRVASIAPCRGRQSWQDEQRRFRRLSQSRLRRRSVERENQKPRKKSALQKAKKARKEEK